MKLFKRDYYEKMFIKRGKTVQDYQLQILQAQDKIKELQAQCGHQFVTPMMYMWRPGAFNPTLVCNSCGSCVPGISEEDKNALWKQWELNLPNNTK